MHKRKEISSSGMEADSLPQLLTIVQVAQLLNVGRSTVYELINEEGLPYVLVRGLKRVAPHSLQWWIQQQERSKGVAVSSFLRDKTADRAEKAPLPTKTSRKKASGRRSRSETN